MSTLVLIGGTGSLSSAILKQQQTLEESGITRIRIISRCEIKQSHLEKSYTGEIELQCFLGDVRSRERMEFALKKADFVIHTAAIKQIERFELDVLEGNLTNIDGTVNVAKAALKNNLKSAIFVSTDKMFFPINSYGVSKLAATHAWQWFNTFQKETKFGICAYGNCWASRGSVIERWISLAKQGLPLPITDNRMTRFFITLENAAKFVLNSLFKNSCEIMIPNMKSAEMLHLAEMINSHYKSSGGVKLVGLRDHREKLHEDLGSMNSNTCERFTDAEIVGMIENG